MTRYAPTLLVGLGGSGVKVLRWLREQQKRSGVDPSRDLLVYRGIDFDLDANSGSRTGPLADGEFHYFDASSIADCVGNLRAELRVRSGEAPRKPFREIAEWYPDIDGHVIRYAQAEAVGARQWRPLGRIGFFLNDVEIMAPLREGLVELDERCGRAGEPRPAAICIVTSIAGGTGSGILMDVAANLRKYRPDIGIRLILLLPEFFEHVDFTSKVLANAYATLTEIAHFKNQEKPFTARYPRLPDIDERTQNALFQRVYLMGPYVGERRPFVEPDLAYAHVADLLSVFLTKELRSNAASYQINDDADQNADAAAIAGETAARQVFCAFSATAIRLLTYDDLASRWAANFVSEWQSSAGRADVFARQQTPPSPEASRKLEDYVEASAAASQADKYLDPANFAALLDDFITHYKPEEKTWNRETLRTFTRKLAQFTGAGAVELPDLLKEPVESFRSTFRDKLRDFAAAYDLTPFALIRELQLLRDRIGHHRDATNRVAYEQLEQFHEWLDGTFDSFLAEPILPQRIDKLKKWLEEWQKTHGKSAGLAWFVSGIRSAAVHELQAEIDAQEAQWKGGDDLVAALQSVTAAAAALDDRRRERFDLDLRHARPAADILAQEMERIDRKPERMRGLARQMLSTVKQHLAEADRSRDYHAAADGLIADLRDLFVRELQPGGRVTAGMAERFRYLSPETTYEDDALRRALLGVRTRIFRSGRVDNGVRKRTGRIVVPPSFAGSDAVTARLKGLCNGLLGAAVRDVSADEVEENRILILVEDLFHSAEELTGIYDYYNDYKRRPRELFHIHADIPRKFGDLITTLRSAGPTLCGNHDCSEDIRHVSRAEIFCPGCGNAIRNRCGNVCSVDDLAERPDAAAVIERGRCPSCENPLRTYWWSCRHHGRMPVTASHCTRCAAEGREVVEMRPAHSDAFICPGCVGRRAERPFRVTGAAADALRGRSADLTAAARALERPLANGTACPQCGVDLAPMCEQGDGPHLLRHDGARWHCDAHPRTIYACGVCGGPLRAEHDFCMRCNTRLADCPFCTPAHAVRVPASGDQRCPRCRLPKRPGCTLSWASSNPSDLFCHNIYGCAAGSDLTRATYPASADLRCVICGDPELRLLQVRVRGIHIDACPFCRVLFERRTGRPRGDRPLPSGACCLCGQLFTTSRTLAGAPHSFDVALRIGSALLETRDDDLAFGILFDGLNAAEQTRIPSHITDYALRVQSPSVRRVVVPRLERLLDRYRQQFGCQRVGQPAAAPVPHRCEPPEPPQEPAAEETVESVLSHARVSRLRTNEDFEQWVGSVVRLGIENDRFEAALGSINAADMGVDDDRLQELRDHARELYIRMTRIS
ncbi:MAG TPA: tubulin-like doman-containing protein [Thermoanaerobaculia bacterium]|jgi:hypothetical protein